MGASCIYITLDCPTLNPVQCIWSLAPPPPSYPQTLWYMLARETKKERKSFLSIIHEFLIYNICFSYIHLYDKYDVMCILDGIGWYLYVICIYTPLFYDIYLLLDRHIFVGIRIIAMPSIKWCYRVKIYHYSNLFLSRKVLKK